MIGIETHDANSGVYNHFPGISKDYRNAVKVFVNYLGYSLIYQTHTNPNVYLTKKQSTNKKNKYPKNFKLKWNGNAFDTFIQNAKSKIVETKGDSLFFLISSHRGKERVIIAAGSIAGTSNRRETQ